MAKTGTNDLLKRRMAASQQASELQTSDEAYKKIFRETPPSVPVQICSLPLDKLVPFFTADIGFRPYSPSQLEAFAEQLNEEGLLVQIIVRPTALEGSYEILAGHNRTSAAKLAGWVEIPAEIVEADDARAIVIATSTNLIQRQNLSIIERGKAYKALLDAKNRQGYRSDMANRTSGENRQKYSARALVSEFFGVTEYEIRKAIKLTQLMQSLAADELNATQNLTALADGADPEKLQRALEETAGTFERSTLELRRLCEKNAPGVGGYGQRAAAPQVEVTGFVEQLGYGWLHIQLNTLLPHCRYRPSEWISDTIRRLLDDYEAGGSIMKRLCW